jgi:hypothetical protein
MKHVAFALVSFVLLAAIAVSAAAQTTGSFRGRLIDADTGQPATQQLTIVVTKVGESDAPRRVIDVAGEFVVPDLSPGRYQIQFREKGIEFETARYVQVTGLSTITPVDIYIRPLAGGITGVVLDENKEPVQGSRVMLVSMHYIAGQVVYTGAGGSTTDDRGYFSISTRVESGLPFFLLALPPEATRPALSGTPSLEAVWYPSRPGLLQPFVLRSDEQKRVDFIMKKDQTHCVDGRLTANGQPASRNFEVAIPEVAGYRGGTGGTEGVISRGQSDASGHFQVCGLWPGEFLIAGGMNKPPTERPATQFLFTADSYGHATVSVVDRDVHDFMLNVQSPVTLAAEIQPGNAQTPEAAYILSILPLSRVAFESQPFLSIRKDVIAPSQFTISLLPATDYVVRLFAFGGASDAYLKDVTCGGTTRRDSFKLDDTDCGLHLTVGTDMGKLTATVVDKDNKIDLNSVVCVYPTAAATREEIALAGTCTSAEPGSTSVSIALRPDKYFAVVMPPGTLDWMEYILANRGPRELFEILPRSTSQLTLKSTPAH